MALNVEDRWITAAEIFDNEKALKRSSLLHIIKPHPAC